ncbi:hypothetical protein VN1178_11990 [Helicobacter pylori]|nr:hypothetical protein VN1178_11990 [Helicobacter pylori]
MTNAPKVKDKPALQSKPLKLKSLRERSWKNQRFTETITLSPKKANSKYNDLQGRLLCVLGITCSLQGGLPHIATMGRDEILQQTPLKHP